MESQRQVRHVRIAIIGAGFGGIGMAARLKQRGEHDFVVFDRAAGVGGTWWVNRYPGCACDVPSHLYSFSFFPNPDWTERFAPRGEIQAYLARCVARFGIRDHLVLGNGIRHVHYDNSACAWRLEDDRGARWKASVVVSAIGGLSRPNIPPIPGLDRFAGQWFHSQQWNDSNRVAGKRIAVIGTGATAAQIVPEIAPNAARVDVYQRTPPWILPRPEAPISPHRRALYRSFPNFQKFVRFGYWLVSEARVPGLAWSNRLAAVHRQRAHWHRRRQVPDPDLRTDPKPDYDIGCKRVVLSSDFYPALMRGNVELVATGVERIEPDAVVARDGQRRRTDVLVLATGFRATDPIPEGMIVGPNGIDLGAHWRDGPEAWRGVAVHGFPNLFLLLGPNTALGHNSVVLIIEAQIDFILLALDRLKQHPDTPLEVSARVQHEYNARLQRRLPGTVWNSGGCSSWYLHPVSGRNTTLWPGFTWTYRRMMRTFPGDAFKPGKSG